MQAAFFDLDKTVIARASMVAFGRPLQRGGLLKRRLLVRGLYAQVVYLLLGADEAQLEKMRRSVLAVTKGWDQSRVSAIVRESLEQVIEPIIYAEALELLQHHRDQGHKVFIVSASPEEVVAPLARYLGVDGAIASRARVDDDGRYTGEMEFWAYGPHKAEAMHGLAAERGLDLSRSYAYSDSATDVPMLEVVGHAVAVNPDRELARVARERGWEVRHFIRPVRLRDRVPVPPAGPTAAVGGSLVAGALGVAAWWWLRRPAAVPPPPPKRRAAWRRWEPAGVAGRSGNGSRPSGPSWRRRRPGRRG